MASSVSSERAFSSAGLTITKRHNWLKADIVEALQFLKCAIRTEFLFWEEVSTWTEEELEVEDDNGDPEWEDVKEKGWDRILLDDESEKENE